jgi:hypothetical protein
MPLRLYALTNSISNAVHGVPTSQGGWWQAATGAAYVLSLDKSDQTGNGAFASTAVNPSSPVDGIKSILIRLAYLVPVDTYFNGTFDLGFASSGFGFTPASMDDHWAVYMFVSIQTLGTLRGVLLNNYADPTGSTNALPGVPAAGRQLNGPVALTPVQALAGDYLHVEIGRVQWDPTNETQRTLYHGTKNSTGGIPADIVSGDVFDYPNTSGASWVEFALLPTPIPQPEACPPCSTDPGTGPDPIGPLPPWTAMCDGGGLVESLADLADGENWAV